MTPLAIIDRDQKLKTLVNELEEAEKRFEERKKFIIKQMENAWNETGNAAWNNIKTYVKDSGLSESYNNKTHGLRIQNGILYQTDKDTNSSDSILDFISNLFR